VRRRHDGDGAVPHEAQEFAAAAGKFFGRHGDLSGIKSGA